MSGNNFGRDDGMLPPSDSDSESGELPADPNDLQEDAQVGDDESLSAGGSPPSDSGTPPASQPSGAKTAWAEGASTTTEMQRTEGNQVPAFPETPNASSALAVGSSQNLRQFWAPLVADIYPEMRRTERGRVLASPETPNASSALAVGSYQNFSQFLAALEADRYPANTSGGPNTTPRGSPSALLSAQAASDRVAASTSRATQQAGPSHIGCARDRPSASRGVQAEDSRLQQRLLEMGFTPASIEEARALLRNAGRPDDGGRHPSAA